MKNYSSRRRGLCIYLVLMLAVMAFAAVLTRNLTILNASIFLVLFLAMVSAFAITEVRENLFQIPNGLPRPEDELPRRTLIRVLNRVDSNTLNLVPVAGVELLRFYEFAQPLEAEIERGRQIVYLDNLETEYLASWKDDGVIPILSAKARAATDGKATGHSVSVEKPAQAHC